MRCVESRSTYCWKGEALASVWNLETPSKRKEKQKHVKNNNNKKSMSMNKNLIIYIFENRNIGTMLKCNVKINMKNVTQF